uniref:Peptidylprolyl isomerase n=2 Tax=Opuntia streptacantha TaxID=393608 RepID=A0A7C8ZCD2_OPUST
MPGFRRQKGGKTSKIPKNLLMDILGKSYVMKFALREIVTSAVATYVEEENLTVKDSKVTTTQTEDELYQSFLPGKGFGFNVELELENEQTETIEENQEINAANA